jgi:AcrR family transcriptional regulator
MTVVHRRPVLPREFIEANRRRSFVLAAAEAAHDAGICAVTAGLLCRNARSARTTFYDHFDNVNHCLRYGIKEAVERLFAPVREAGGKGREWLLEVDRAIAGFYAAAAAEPLLAELLLVHSIAVPLRDGDPDLDTGVDAMAALLVGGRGQIPTGSAPVPLAEEYLSRVIISMAVLKLRQGEAETLPALSREMTLLVGDTYLDIAETGRILDSTGYPGSPSK